MITAMTKDALVAHFLNHWKKWAGGICFLILVTAFVLSDDLAKLAGYGAELPKDKSEMSPGARFFRDFVVFVIAAIGIVLAIRRAIDLNRQAKTAESQFELANKQFKEQSATTTKQFKQAEDRMFNERFTTAAELMAKEVAGKPAIAARVSGIHIMGELANAAPDIFLAQTLNTMVAYIKDNVRVTATPPLPSVALLPAEPSILGEDVKTAFAVVDGLFAKRRNGKLPGKLFPNFLDLSYADFSYLDLTPHQVGGLNHFKWECANFSGAVLHTAVLEDAHLFGAIFHGADLSLAQLGGALLHNAELDGATLAISNLRNYIVNQKTAPVEVSGASFRWTIAAGALIHFKNWDIKCFATDFSGAGIEVPPSTKEKERMASQIWHNMTPGLEDIREQDEGHWDLASCPTTSALVGAFRNFAEKPKDKYQDNPTERAKSFRTAAVKLLVDGKLPSDFPHDLRQWVERDLKPDPDYGVGVL